MPEKTKTYERVVFTPEVIKEAESIVIANLPKKGQLQNQLLSIELPSGEEWEHDNEDEYFADYRKGFKSAIYSRKYHSLVPKFPTYNVVAGSIRLYISCDIDDVPYTKVSIEMPIRSDTEKVFSVLEANVDKCRLPKQPKDKSKAETDWVNETIDKIENHCPIAAHKVKLALIKLDSENTEEWQNANMLIRDAWIELAQWLCKVNNIDTSDIPADSVIERLKKLKIHVTDERLFNLAKASFSLYSKHHKRDIDLDTAVACVISTIVSMKTVIKEALHATS